MTLTAPHALPSALASQTLAVCRPWAPPAESLLPYLRRMDEARWYSNFGPLVLEFEARLSERFTAPTQIVTATNATLALSMALRVRAPEPGLCLMPAWTFVATAHAAKLAGHTPFLADVAPDTGALTPEIARAALQGGPLRAVIPVAPHGQALDLRAWATFEAETGVPVIIDAAAGFDTATDAIVPIVVSLHATKSLGAGEGGFLATQDSKLAAAFRAQSVFGFAGSRDSTTAAMNAKMSEYGAAVGLAALDHWPQTRQRYMRAARLLRAAFARDCVVSFQTGWGGEWISAACAVQLRSGDADRAARALASQNIETRRWWDRGVHRQPAFRAVPKADGLPVTDRLATATLGLPFSLDLSAEDVARIAEALRGL